MTAGPGSGHAAAGSAPGGSAPTAQQRAEFRAFVRRHHPDVGGDPETFRRGLARFRALGIVPSGGPGAADGTDHREWWPADDDPRLDAPITAVSGDPLHRLGRAGLRAWRHNPLRRGSGRVV